MTHLELKYPPGGPEIWGPLIWDSFTDVANSIPCGECRPFGQQLIKAGHDLVNLNWENACMIRRIFSHSKIRLIRLFKRCIIHGIALLLGLSPVQVIDVWEFIRIERRIKKGTIEDRRTKAR